MIGASKQSDDDDSKNDGLKWKLKWRVLKLVFSYKLVNTSSFIFSIIRQQINLKTDGAYTESTDFIFKTSKKLFILRHNPFKLKSEENQHYTFKFS